MIHRWHTQSGNRTSKKLVPFLSLPDCLTTTTNVPWPPCFSNVSREFRQRTGQYPERYINSPKHSLERDRTDPANFLNTCNALIEAFEDILEAHIGISQVQSWFLDEQRFKLIRVNFNVLLIRPAS